MSINAAASTAVSSSSQVSTSAGAENTKKTDSSSSSFKDEMDKVSSENSKDKASDNKSDEVAEKKNTEDNSIKDNIKNEEDDNNITIKGQIEYEKFASMSLLDANSMLQNNIYQMTNRDATVMTVELSSTEDNSNDSLMFNSLSMTQADAEFFVNLTQNNDAVSYTHLTLPTNCT